MCGRFAFFSPSEAVVAAFGADISFQVDPRYNIAPSQNVSILHLDDSGELRVDNYRWGLVPFWAKDPAIGNRMINARAETVAEKPSYRQSFSRRRWAADDDSTSPCAQPAHRPHSAGEPLIG